METQKSIVVILKFAIGERSRRQRGVAGVLYDVERAGDAAHW